LLALALARTPGRRHDDGRRALVGQRAEQLREPDVVAGGETERGAVDVQRDRFGARGDGVRLTEAERVVEVDLVVAEVVAEPGDQQRVAHPAVVAWCACGAKRLR